MKIYIALFTAMFLGFIFGVLIMTGRNNQLEQPKIKPCNCLTYYEWQLLSTKRDIILDKRKRSETDNMTLDSINVKLGLPSRR